MNNFLIKLIWRFLLIALLSISYTVSAQTVHIIMFNDFHGAIDETATEPGMAKFVAAVKNEQQRFPNSIVVAGGDNYHDSAIAGFTHGKIVSQMMKELHVAVSAVGNHDFDWGPGAFKIWEKDGQLSYLAANIIDKRNHKVPAWAKPYAIIHCGGYKIAFIGLATTWTTILTDPQNTQGLDFINAAQAAQVWLDYLMAGKDPEGKPDAIIALTHIPTMRDFTTHQISGEEMEDLISHTNHFDAILSAHSHQYVIGKMFGVPILQARSYGKYLGNVALHFNDTTHQLEHVKLSLISLVAHKKNINSDPKALAIYQKYAHHFNRILSRVIGKTDVILARFPEKPGEESLLQWACKILRDTTKTDIALLPQGMLRGSLFPGNITLKEMYEVFPDDDLLILCDLNGEQILKLFNSHISQQKGLKIGYAGVNLQWNPSKTEIIGAILDDGSLVKKDHNYRVATNELMFYPRPGVNILPAKKLSHTGVIIRDTLIKALERNYSKS